MTQEAIWNIFEMLWLTLESWVDLSISWIRVCFYGKTGERILIKFFMKRQARRKK